jgi:beta-lactamase superfamily II metal-dependent hydrolase
VATPLQIFISSPGDVRPERLIAQRVIDRLAREFAAQFDISAIRWERNPLLATDHFQAQIPKASEADIVVVIIWARLGTPLGVDFKGAISGNEVTGTEFEFEDAINAAKTQGKPDVLMYQKEGVPSFEKKEEVSQYQKDSVLVDEFFARWFKPAESEVYKAAWRTFRTIDQFELLLHEHLTGLLEERVSGGGAIRATTGWHRGSPFRGLESFEAKHGPIFFGRTRAQSDLRQLLVRQVARRHPWMTVVGPSGSGKSSLVKAGLVPDLATPGLIDRVVLCRHAIVRPSDADKRLIDALIAALLRDGALPELSALDYDAASLAAAFTKVPESAALPIRQALTRASETEKLREGAEARIVLIIDQLEELFADPPDRTTLLGWLAVFDAFASSGFVWIVATLRADFLQEFERVRPLADRFDAEGRYVLAAPNDTELGQMVTRPARAAALSFESHPETHVGLEDALIAAARADRTALPLLEYLLEQLWQRRTPTGLLTWKAYDELGGLDGVIASRAEQVFRSLPGEVQDALPRVLRALVRIAPGDAKGLTAQQAPRSQFPAGSPSTALVEAFVNPDARLLVSTGDGETATIRVAHEALFSHWPLAKLAIERDRKDLEVRERIAHDTKRWHEASGVGRDSLLLPPGLRFTEAEDLVERRGDELDDLILRYVEQSRAKHEDELSRERRRRQEAELAERRAAAEEHFARAGRIATLAKRVSTERWRPDRKEYAAILESRAITLQETAERLWGEAYELHKSLGPGRSTPLPGGEGETIFSLEMLDTSGDCLLVHYGTVNEPRFIVVDGGSRATFKNGLLRRLEELHQRWSVDGVLTIELVMVSHYDADRVEGIYKLLGFLAAEGAGRFRIRRLWYNNLTQIIPASAVERNGFKEELRGLADTLEIPINEPFDYFVMPSDLGPVAVTLPGGLRVTVLGPRRERITNWYRHGIKEQRQRRSDLPAALVRQLDAVSESASNPEMIVLRAPPRSAGLSPSLDGVGDASVNNLSSIVAHLELAGHTMLLTGDAREDDIIAGLFDAWLVDATGRVQLDLLKVPHWASRHNVSAALFAHVPAEHYVIPGHHRYGLPRAKEIGMLAQARGAATYTVYVSQHDPKIEPAVVEAITANGRGGRARFLGDGKRSLIVDTMAKVTY